MMQFSNQGRMREKGRFLRRQYLQDGALPSSDILTQDFIGQALAAVEGVWKDRIYTPLITLWVFLKPGIEPGPFVSGRGRTPYRSSSFSRPTSLLPRDRCLLPSQNALTGRS